MSPSTRTRRDLLIAPVCEAALILVLGLAAWATHRPLLFASLGPTAYELVETPESRTARPYNILVAHTIAVLAALAAVSLFHAWSLPFAPSNHTPLTRVLAAAVAALLTVFGTVVLKATQPAAVSTTLLMSLGAMQTPRDGLMILVAICLLTAMGEPLRRWRLRHLQSADSPAVTPSR